METVESVDHMQWQAANLKQQRSGMISQIGLKSSKDILDGENSAAHSTSHGVMAEFKLKE
eukprot:COSAG02_NODE_46903_length_345_cov_0.731707_1_plen_59_part_10